MKVIKKIQIEYVVPETEAEKAEIKAILHRVEVEKGKSVDLSEFSVVDNRKKINEGYWKIAQ